ncbi:MAG: hypothetical protein AAFV71_29290 [Cyanobacteria bacterium J06633_8]
MGHGALGIGHRTEGHGALIMWRAPTASNFRGDSNPIPICIISLNTTRLSN